MRTFVQKQNQPHQKSSASLTRQNKLASSPSHDAHPLLNLQRTIGNQAVLRLLQARADGLGAASNTEVGPTTFRSETPSTNRFDHDLSRVPVHAPAQITIQPKLAVNTPGDIYEQEADHIAEQVMRMPEPKLQRVCDCAGGCAECQTEQPVSKHQALQTKHVGPSDSGQIAAPPIVHEVLASPGQPLDTATRAFMEPRFGHDFSRVRVHSGATAEQSARGVNANAYTVGHNIVFGEGRLALGTNEGQRLIAHELAHVVQQTSASAGAALQRDDPKTQPQVVPQDFAVLLSPDPDFVTLTTVIAPSAKILRATTVEDLVKQLKAIKVPIGTVYFVAHMTEEGDLMFTAPGKKPGDVIMEYVPADIMASKIKDSARVGSIDFRGCSIAQAPGEMEKIRGALKATKATGSTCTLVTHSSDPITTVGGKKITQPEQLKDKRVKADFVAGRTKLRELFLDKKKNCIVNDTVDGYFQTGGRLIAAWVNPDSMADSTGWDDKKSICYRDLKLQRIDPTKKLPVIDPDDCKLIEVRKKP